jgi:origin recognition complex subunit 2
MSRSPDSFSERDESLDKDDGNHDKEDDDEEDAAALQSFLLRFRFQDHSFLRLWRSLSECGWVYEPTTRAYRSPLGRRFAEGGAIEVAQYLDVHAVQPTVRGSLDDPSESPGLEYLYENEDNLMRRPLSAWTSDELEEAWMLREKALTHIWKEARRRQKEESGDPAGDRDHEDDGSDSLGLPLHQPPARRSQRLREVQLAATTKTTATAGRGRTNQESSSAAVTEKGTAMYLSKHSTRHKFKKPRITNAGATSLAPVSIESLKVPTVDECRQKLLRERSRQHRAKGGAAGSSVVDTRYRGQFSSWRWLLSTNHSLLFYGAGSKLDLLNAFADEELSKEGHVLVLNGFDKDISIEGIIDLMATLFLEGGLKALLDGEGISRVPHLDGIEGVAAVGTHTPWKAEPVVERAIQLGRALAERSGETLLPIYLVIHTLEGLGCKISMEALSQLLVNSIVGNGAASVRLAASMDHVDAPLLWNATTTSANLAFLYQQVHTGQPYVEELAMLPSNKKAVSSKRKADASAQVAQRVFQVLQTLAPRNAEVIQILARLQLEAIGGEPSSARGGGKSMDDPHPRIPYRELYEQCKVACAVTKDSHLRGVLRELEDHGMLRYGDDWASIPYDASKLREFLSYKPGC